MSISELAGQVTQFFPPNIVPSLLANITLLVSLSIVHSVIMRRWAQRGLPYQVLSGLLFGGVALVGMMTPIKFSPGVIFDGRSIIIAVAGIFGGPAPAVIAAVIAAVYRWNLGGGGAIMGVSVISESAALGIAFHYFRRYWSRQVGGVHFYAIGLLVHLVMLWMIKLLPVEVQATSFRQLTLPIVGIYPLATFLVCIVFLDQESRVLAEKALRRSEEKYRELVENVNSMILQWTPDGIIGFANDYANEFFGYEKGELTGKPVVGTIVAPTDSTGRDLAAMMQDITLHPERYEDNENENVCRDGRRVWVHWTNRPVWDEGGGLAGVFCVGYDMTERRRMEEARRESEAAYRTIFDQNPLSVTVSTLAGHFIEVNEEFLKGVHLAREEVIGKTAQSLGLVGSEGQDPIGELLAANEGVIDRARIRIAIPGRGEYRDLIVSSKMIQLHREPAVLTIVNDITDQERTERELGKAQALFSTAVEHSPAGILVADAPDGRIRLANTAALRIRGECLLPVTDIPLEEHQARWSVLRPDGSPFEPQEMPLYLAVVEGKTCHNVEALVRQDSGEERHILITAAPVVDRDGRITGAVAVFPDVTERKKAEEERRKLEEQLQQAQKMEAIGHLAGGIAHDFNNLLQVILGHMDLLQNRVEAKTEAWRGLDDVRRAAVRAAELTKQLLAFSRRQVIQPTATDLNDLVQGVLKMIRSVIGEHIELCFMPGVTLGTVYVDRGQIEQVLMNLCVNARDAMEEGGRLVIETHATDIDEQYCRDHSGGPPGRYACLSVSDTGCGMDEETRARAFEPFFTTKEIGKGTGLGLATVYGIIKQHNGLVNLVSSPGRGSIVEIFLPIVDYMPVEPERERPPRALGGSETILMAEDEPMVRRLVAEILEEAGYHVITACDGREALALFESHKEAFDLVLVDVVMPGLSGTAVMEEVRKSGSRVPFLFSSGYNEDMVHARFPMEKDHCLIKKPYRREDLLDAVRRMLDGPADGPGEGPRKGQSRPSV